VTSRASLPSPPATKAAAEEAAKKEADEEAERLRKKAEREAARASSECVRGLLQHGRVWHVISLRDS
jgi:DNA-binding GntR family transcriptional regulator